MPIPRPALLLALALAVGCQQSKDPLAPAPAAGPGPVPQGRMATAGDLTLQGIVLGRLEVDPGALSASFEPEAGRSGQVGDTEQVYDLSIGQYLKPTTFHVTGVGRTDKTFTITYGITHPFPAPNLAKPASASNRADLSFAGRVLFLADVASPASNTYFANVVANTSYVLNADGYVKPGGMLDTPGMTANTFPFKVIADQALDTITSTTTGAKIDRGLLPGPGNYHLTIGWQRDTMGTTADRWAGFSVLHQGQTAGNSLDLDLDALGQTPTSFDIAILIKYVDPRGGTTTSQKLRNRLPANPADITKFVYRHPHGSMDVEKVEWLGEGGGFLANQLSSSEFRLRVRDWDARASVTTKADLADDPVASKIAPEEWGDPTLSVCIPGITGDSSSELTLGNAAADDDSAFGGDADADTGWAGDELFFRESVSKLVLSGQTAGNYTGLIRVQDPEAATDPAWHWHLTPEQVPLQPGENPFTVTYQRIRVVQQAGITGWAARMGGTSTDLVAAMTLAGSDPVVGGTFGGSANLGGGSRISQGSTDGAVVKTGANGQYLWDYTFGSVGADTVTGVATDPEGNVYVLGTIGGRAVNFGGGWRAVRSSPDAFLVKLNPEGVYQWDRMFGNDTGSETGAGIAANALGQVAVTGTFNSDNLTVAGTDLLSSSGDAAFLGMFATDGQGQWSRAFDGAVGSSTEAGRGVALDSTGRMAVLLEYATNNLDIGTGPLAMRGVRDVAVVQLTAARIVESVWTLGGPGEDRGRGVAWSTVANGPLATGSFTSGGMVDLGNGPVSTAAQGFDIWFAKPAPGAAAVTAGGPGADHGLAVAVDGTGAAYVAGQYSQDCNFGQGARVSRGGLDCFVIKRSAASLSPLWEALIGGTGNDGSAGLGVSLSQVYSAGFFRATVDMNPGTGTTNLSSLGQEDWFVTRAKTSNGRW
ncbi:MAG TPA: hypothetical protein VEI97_20780 [bacterium]|nr:hypothetical protein [bacterium]